MRPLAEARVSVAVPTRVRIPRSEVAAEVRALAIWPSSSEEVTGTETVRSPSARRSRASWTSTTEVRMRREATRPTTVPAAAPTRTIARTRRTRNPALLAAASDSARSWSRAAISMRSSAAVIEAMSGSASASFAATYSSCRAWVAAGTRVVSRTTRQASHAVRNSVQAAGSRLAPSPASKAAIAASISTSVCSLTSIQGAMRVIVLLTAIWASALWAMT